MKKEKPKLNWNDRIFVAMVVMMTLTLCIVPVIIWMTNQPCSMPERVMDTVVHITAYCDYTDDYNDEYYKFAGVSWQGSGCFVSDDGVIITAGHIVENADRFVITMRDGTELETTIAMYADNLDVGFIKVDVNEPVSYLEFDPDGVALVEDIYIFGHPLGDYNIFSVTKGIVSNYNRDCRNFFGERLMLQVDAASWPGNSGSPVVDEEGEIIGILVGGFDSYECICYVAPGDACYDWLTVFESWLGTRVDDAKSTT